MAGRQSEQNKEATIYVGNLDERFAEPLMWELMTQMGPVVNVHMPMDRVSRQHLGFGFVEFDTPESADYASRCLNGVRLFGKPVRVNKASADRQRATDIGAELFVNNLDLQVDEKILYDTFVQFGRLVVAPNIVRDQNNVSKGYGFVSFDSFEASDAARGALHGQYLLSQQISVEYAYKKDGKGERHGDESERKLAAEGKKHNVVPEIQPLPPAFLMNRPSAVTAGAGADIVAATSGANATPLMLNGHHNPNHIDGHHQPQHQPQHQPLPQQQLHQPLPLQQQPNGGSGDYPPPQGLGGGGGGYNNGYQQQPLQQQQQQYPRPQYGGSGGAPSGYGGRGGVPPQNYGGGSRSGGPGLPAAPSGLPARPPPGSASGSLPPGAPGLPGSDYRNMPPPGLSNGTSSLPLSGPPGYNGMPPPPPGFGRR